MPSRPFIPVIVLFWAVAVGWLFHREYWPFLRPGEPPLFHIDLLDQTARRGGDVEWLMTRNGEKLYRLRTEVRYQKEDDTFELHGGITTRLQDRESRKQEEDVTVDLVYKVTREGELREVRIERAIVKKTVRLTGPLRGRVVAQVSAQLSGPVVDGVLTPHWAGTLQASSPTGDELSIPFDRVGEPVRLEARTSVLNPLMPLNRLPDLRTGQRWRLVLNDPLSDALSAALPGLGGGPQYLDAEVLPGTEVVRYRERDEPCHVIAYRGEEAEARTLVRVSDGLVLRQEATVGGDHWVLERQR